MVASPGKSTARLRAPAPPLSYIGFDCVSTLAEETRNPAVDMPVGIVRGCAWRGFR